MQRLIIIVSWTSILVWFAGCGKDYQRIADEDVQTRLLDPLEKTEAIPFFEQKGRYFDAANGQTTVDQDIVLPLLKRLKGIAATDQWVVLREDDNSRAFALLIELPRDTPTLDRMEAALKEADDQFSGSILQQWGKKWLSLMLIDQKSYEFIKKHKPNVEFKR